MMDDNFSAEDLLSGITSGDAAPEKSTTEADARFIPGGEPDRVSMMDLLRANVFTEHDLEMFTHAHEKTAETIGEILGGIRVTPLFSGAVLTEEFRRSMPADASVKPLRFMSGRYKGFFEADASMAEHISAEASEKITGAIDLFPTGSFYLKTESAGADAEDILHPFSRLVFCSFSAVMGDREYRFNIGYAADLAARMLGIPYYQKMAFDHREFFIGSCQISRVEELSCGRSILLPENCPPVLVMKNDEPAAYTDDPYGIADRIRLPLSIRLNEKIGSIRHADGCAAAVCICGTAFAEGTITEKNGRMQCRIERVIREIRQGGQILDMNIPVYAEIGRVVSDGKTEDAGASLRLDTESPAQLKLVAGSSLCIGTGEALSCDGTFGLRMLTAVGAGNTVQNPNNLRCTAAVRMLPFSMLSSVQPCDTVVFETSFDGDALIFDGAKPYAHAQLREQDGAVSAEIMIFINSEENSND